MPPPSSAADVVVVGGGIAGASVAYNLAGMGATVTLVDRHHAGRATDAGAGILSPQTSGNPLHSWFELVMACGAYYEDLIDELAETGAPDTGYARCGLLTVALADWDIGEYDAVADLALQRGRATGADIRAVDAQEAASHFPPGAPITRALYNPVAARIDGRKITAALLHAAIGRGVQVVEGSAEGISLSGGRVTAVTVGGGTLACGALVVAGGAWSPALGEQLGVSLPIFPDRGQIIHLDVAPDGGHDTGEWSIFQPAFGFYFVSWPGGRVVVGATRERAGFDVRPTVAGVRQVLDEVARVAPGLTSAAIADIRVGLRPVSKDELPILGPLPGLANAHAATGYGANGLLLSPWCGHLVAAGVVGTVPAELDAFRADRFRPKVVA